MRKRHLVLADARGDLRVVVRLRVEGVQLPDRSDDVALTRLADAVRTPHVEHGVALGVERHALEAARQEAAVPLPRRDRLPLAAADRRQHDEARQVVALAAEAIREPRAHARAPRDQRARVHEGLGRIVVDRLGLQRADDADLVGDRTDVGQHGGDLLLRLPEASERMLGTEDLQRLPLQLRDRLALREGLGHRLAVQRRELRLVVEGLQL
jgi:hypothetical protein